MSKPEDDLRRQRTIVTLTLWPSADSGRCDCDGRLDGITVAAGLRKECGSVALALTARTDEMTPRRSAVCFNDVLIKPSVYQIGERNASAAALMMCEFLV